MRSPRRLSERLDAVRRQLATFDRQGQPAVHAPIPHSHGLAPQPPRFVAMSLFFYVKHFAHVAGHIPEHQPSGGGAVDAAAAAASAAGAAGGGGGGGGGGGSSRSTSASAAMLEQVR